MIKLLKRAWAWVDDRTGITQALLPILRHPVPPGTGWKYVFGSAILFAFMLQVVTGMALATAYIPSAGQAYEALQFISHDAAFGHILRGMHYFGASAMVLMVGIHMIRTFLTGSYKFPREMNWILGVGLLGLTILMGFTGQLLRWDQDGVWSTIVAAEQAGRVPFIGKWLAQLLLGGQTVGGATLSRFFAYHVFFIPALIFAFVGLHLALVLKHGISEPPKAGHPVDPATYRAWYADLLKREGVPFFPDVGWRDVVFGVATIAAIVALAWVFGAPNLTKPPDPTIIEAYPRPDWYLLWYFAVLAQLPHGTETYVIVLAPLTAGLVLLLLPIFFNKGERSPSRRPWAVASVVLIVTAIGTLWVAGQRSPWSPDFNSRPLSSKSDGALLFHSKGCENCHRISGRGGQRGPDLTTVGDRLTADQITIRVMNGGNNMPAYAGNLKPEEMNVLRDFLQSRTQAKAQF